MPVLRSKPIRTYTPATVRVDSIDIPVPLEMTLPEFQAFAWPEGQRWELIWGTPVMSPSPLPSHQDLVGELYLFLRGLCVEPLHAYFGVDILLPASDNYLCPDISVIDLSTQQNENARPMPGVPRLVLESLSPSTRGNDGGAKLEAYAAGGVPEYWIANPATGALSILVEPQGLEFKEVLADGDGFVRSPLLDLSIRVRRDGSRFRVETKA